MVGVVLKVVGGFSEGGVRSSRLFEQTACGLRYLYLGDVDLFLLQHSRAEAIERLLRYNRVHWPR